MAGSDPLIGMLLGGYRLVEQVEGRDPGIAYRARDEERDRDVVLKLFPIDPLDDQRQVESAQRQVGQVAALDHPDIAAVYDCGRDAGYLYIATEWTLGESLLQMLQREERLSVERTLVLGDRVLAALESAHGQQIIHRGIRAENLMCQEGNGIKLLGFGMVGFDGEPVLARSDEILGSIEYMAPEQILGDEVGPAVDLYAVGALLYEMLTGRLPFIGDSPATLVYRQLNEEAFLPSQINAEVPHALDLLVLRLLDKLPENRPVSARATREELAAIRQRLQFHELPMGEAGVEDEGEEIRTRDFRPRFVGRKREFEALCGHFDGLEESGGTVFLTGEAGVGKTRMVEELTAYAEKNGGRVILGGCFFEYGPGSYMPVLDALSDLFNRDESDLTGEERGRLVQLLEEEAPELAELAQSGITTSRVREGFAAALGGEKNAETARQRLFDTILQLLARAAEQRPLILVLEDMHWADEGSLLLLQHLARRVAEARLLCVVTLRPEELADEEGDTHLLKEIWRGLETGKLLQKIELERLGKKSILELARSLFLEVDFDADFGDFLYAQSEGNPFIAIEVLKLLRHQGVLYRQDGVWSVQQEYAGVIIPDRVSALIMRRLDGLDAELREMLQIAAIIGPGFTPKVLEKTAGMSRIDLLKALFRLEKNYRLIVGKNGAYDFGHAKIREVLYEEIPWELRSEYHRIIATVLEEVRDEGQEVDEALLGHHLYEGEEFARALPYLERVADQAYQLFDWRLAADLFAQVVKASQHSGGDVESLVHALELEGRSYESLAFYDRALEKFELLRQVALENERLEAEADAWLHVGRAHKKTGQFENGIAAYRQAIECLEPGEGQLVRGRALLNWGSIDFECGQYEQAKERWLQSLVLFEEMGASEVGHALSNLAVLATVRGDLDEALELYERALALDAGEGPSIDRMLTLYSMGMLRVDQERWDDALDLYAQSMELCKATRALVHEPAIELNQAEALIGKGNLVAAREVCSKGLRGFRRLDDGLGVADALRLYGRICRLERDWQEADTCLEKSIDLNRQFEGSVYLGEALYELGLLKKDEGAAAAALDALREAEGIFAQAQAALDLNRVRTVLKELEAA
jgi:tetratricopeptide (TPR) repeat protein